jgi:PAS domain S-box-containing protein
LLVETESLSGRFRTAVSPPEVSAPERATRQPARRARWSLWQQLAVTLVLVVGVTLLLGLNVMIGLERGEVHETIREQRETKLALLLIPLAETVHHHDKASLERILNDFVVLDPALVSLRVEHADGRELLSWSRDATVAERASSERVAVTFQGTTLGALEVTWDDAGIEAEVIEHVMTSALFFLGGLLLMSLLLYFALQRLALAPLRRLTARLQEIASGELEGRLPEATSREMAMLSGAVNDLGDALLEKARANERLVRATSTLEHLQRRSELVLDTAGDGIIGLDADGNVEFLNETASQLLGCSKSDGIGMRVLDLVHLGRPEEVPLTERDGVLLDAIEHGRTLRVADGTFWRWNRRPFPVEYSSTPIRQKGRVEGAVVVFRNVAERRRIEQEQRLAAITFDSKEAMMVTDAQGVIMRVNQAFTQISGYTAEEAVGRNAGFQKSGRHDRAFYGALWQALLDDGHWEGEVWNRRKDGELYPLWYSISAVRNDAGETTHYVSHATDLSRVKQTELELRAAIATAEAANQAKAGFLATMSHEMRTPLNAVLGMLGLLQDAELAPRLRDYVTTAREAGEGLLDLIGDILDFEKMDAGKLELEAAPFDGVRLLTQVSALLQQRAEEKGLRFRVVVAEGERSGYLGDAGRIRQVLLNLAGNAIKFTEQGEVCLELVVTPVDRGRSRLSFSVTDTGIGIPETLQVDLFTEFTTLDATYARRYDGAGLGLAISRRLVELMGGTIGFSSREGEGSRFWFEIELDACALPAVEEGGDGDGLPAQHHARVLLAEDVAANRKLAKELLERAGHTVDAVSDGEEAVTAVCGFPYDLVLMDISMPGVDGLEATRRIRDLPGALGHIPIVAMTAHAMAGDREAFLAAGMDDYLQKPVNRKSLLGMVARWCEGGGAQTPPGPVRAGAAASAEDAADRSAPNEAGGESGPVDAGTLEQLGRDTSPELVPELVGLFVADARERIARIGAALTAGDLAVVDHEVHALGSSSATYGLPGVHRLARRCEQALREGQEVQGRARAEELVAQAAAAFEALERHVAPAAGASA